MPWSITGIIEGFYGRPWSWDERAEVMRWCHDRGMTTYVYAPKDDPKHRDRWREPYGDETLGGFARLVGERTLRVGFGISPGLSIDCWSDEDRRALLAKVEQVLATGIDLVVLALDDIPFGGREQGQAHAALTSWLRDHLGSRAALTLVPTEYVGMQPTPYLTALAAGTPTDVPIAWTGPMVVNDRISAAEASARADALGGRPPLVWDNFPVNDGLMADRLHLGPLWGRDADLAGTCSGYLANPMVQPRASKLALASAAAWLRGEDPLDAWAHEAEALGVRVLAEACDGAVPQALVQSAVEWVDDDERWPRLVAPLRAWLEAAAACDAGALGEEVQPWVDQVRAEARLGLDALGLVDLARSRAGLRAIEHGFAVGYGTREAQRAAVSVMGVRYGFQPALGQASDGTFAFEPTSIITGRNAIDRLVAAALAFLGARSR